MLARFVGLLATALALLSIACKPTAAPVVPIHPACPQVAQVVQLTKPVAEEISVDQLALMLPKHPIKVGFDVDDTLIFSAPAFNALQPKYDPDVIRPKDYKQLTPEMKQQYHDFWDKLNNEYDDRSTPKQIGKRLLDLHIARGDTIVIISKRQSPSDDSDPCTPRYERMFDVKLQRPVIQTQLKDKTPFICREHLDYYYGDSDSDVLAALTAGVTPIRVKRAADSYARDVVHNGQLGEIVLKDSEK
jgi:acid phosphatase (class B)